MSRNDQKKRKESSADDDRIRRALNVQWNLAENYTRSLPRRVQKIFDRDRSLSPEDHFFYLNGLLGILQDQHDVDRLSAYVSYLLEEVSEGGIFVRMMAYPLEKGAGEKLISLRPVFESYRKHYWRDRLDQFQRIAPADEIEFLDMAHGQRALGQVPKISPLTLRLLDDLEALSGLPTPDFIEGMQKVLKTNFHFNPSLRQKEKLKEKVLTHKKNAYKRESLDFITDEEVFQEMNVVSAEFNENIFLDKSDKSYASEENSSASVQPKSQVRQFMEKNYGPPLLSPREEALLRREAAQGIHKDEHFLMTRGFSFDPKEIQEALDQMDDNPKMEESLYWHPELYQEGGEDLPYRQRLMRRARIDNEAYVRDNHRKIHRAVTVLTEKLRSAVKDEIAQGTVYEDHGRLDGAVVWKTPVLSNNKVFFNPSQDEPGELVVDILLDSSASQLDRKERVATQAYILVQALQRVNIPFRVTSFQSQQGYTILKLFHGYGEKSDPHDVLSYFPDAANRDGFALRLVKAGMKRKGHAKNVLIVLSDGKPLDQRVGINIHSFDPQKSYKEERAIQDTAEQVRLIRADQVAVFGLFTGVEEDLPAAKKIYGHGLAYIKDIDRFAEIVAGLLQDQIRELR